VRYGVATRGAERAARVETYGGALNPSRRLAEVVPSPMPFSDRPDRWGRLAGFLILLAVAPVGAGLWIGFHH
jgi:hypothetical protein